jgi:hypothetical protein
VNPSPPLMRSDAYSFSKTHSKEGRKLNYQWYPLVEDFLGEGDHGGKERTFLFFP